QNFESKLSKMESLLSTTDPKLAALLQAVKSELPLTGFDNTSFSVADIEHDIDVFRTNLSERMKALKAAIDKRLAGAARSLAASDQASDPLTRLDSLGQAASALLGDSVKLIPEFELMPSQQSELADAYAVSKSGALLDFLKSTKQIEDPV